MFWRILGARRDEISVCLYLSAVCDVTLIKTPTESKWGDEERESRGPRGDSDDDRSPSSKLNTGYYRISGPLPRPAPVVVMFWNVQVHETFRCFPLLGCVDQFRRERLNRRCEGAQNRGVVTGLISFVFRPTEDVSGERNAARVGLKRGAR